MANEKQIRMNAQEAITKAEQELITSFYIADISRSPGMKVIHSNRCRWLSVIVGLAKKAVNMDAVEVVRCKDCKHREDGLCPMESVEQYPWFATKNDGFCSYGERREGK